MPQDTLIKKTAMSVILINPELAISLQELQ